MKIGEALRTQASSLYSATPIGAPMNPAPIGVADRTRKKNYWRTVPGHHCLLAEGDICAPIYWRTDPPVHRVDRVLGFLSSRLRQSARLSLQSSELGPQPLNPQVSVSPPFGARGVHTCLQERGWVGSQYWQTDKKN